MVNNIDAVLVRDRTGLDRGARLLQVPGNNLLDALTMRTIFTRGESVTTTMGVENSIDVRDAFIKGKIFIYSYDILYLEFIKILNKTSTYDNNN